MGGLVRRRNFVMRVHRPAHSTYINRSPRFSRSTNWQAFVIRLKALHGKRSKSERKIELPERSGFAGIAVENARCVSVRRVRYCVR